MRVPFPRSASPRRRGALAGEPTSQWHIHATCRQNLARPRTRTLAHSSTASSLHSSPRRRGALAGEPTSQWHNYTTCRQNLAWLRTRTLAHSSTASSLQYPALSFWMTITVLYLPLVFWMTLMH